MATPRIISPKDARAYLLTQLGLRRMARRRGLAGVRDTLASLRCIQLDPLDPMGTNADLVALARVEDIERGDVYRATLKGHGFEHFAKERCILPASAFPFYRDQAAQTPWWRLSQRTRQVPPQVLDAIVAEIEHRGPSTSSELEDRGRVVPTDWSGWKGTSSMTSMALQILWNRCRLVVHERTSGGKRYEIPSRALPVVAHEEVAESFGRWALRERVEAAGLLARATGPCWSMLESVFKSSLPDELVEEGVFEQVQIEGSRRTYLAPAGFLDRPRLRDDGKLRIVGPLDPLLWDRKLVACIFGFEYIWEVYKPAKLRRWGWYVCPLLHRGKLVGRLEGSVRDGGLVIDNLWPESSGSVDMDALDQALERHAIACGAEWFQRPELET
ncbi:MAG: winged helix DNA-binding domain-containing protein [Deltaproteobacteria bacterium]|nr:winged helix DNA-binding domain-containing protein [Deltaproteobacteria bacterium]